MKSIGVRFPKMELIENGKVVAAKKVTILFFFFFGQDTLRKSLKSLKIFS